MSQLTRHYKLKVRVRLKLETKHLKKGPMMLGSSSISKKFNKARLHQVKAWLGSDSWHPYFYPQKSTLPKLAHPSFGIVLSVDGIYAPQDSSKSLPLIKWSVFGLPMAWHWHYPISHSRSPSQTTILPPCCRYLLQYHLELKTSSLSPFPSPLQKYPLSWLKYQFFPRDSFF